MGRRSGRSDTDSRLIERREKSFRKMMSRLTRDGRGGSVGSFIMRTTPTGFGVGDAEMQLTMGDLGVVRTLDGRGRLQRLVIEKDEAADEAED